MEKREVYKKLKQLIIEQVYRPEQMLNEKELMKAFEIGRTPLREVLFDLQREGLVNVIPRCGTFISSLSLGDLQNLSRIRPTLEGLVAEILCDCATQQDFDVMEDLLERAEEIIDQSGGEILSKAGVVLIRNLESEIHTYMYDVTQNPYLIYMCRQLEANCERYWAYANMDKNGLITQIRDHRRLFNAICNRDKALSSQIAQEHSRNFIRLVTASLSNGGLAAGDS